MSPRVPLLLPALAATALAFGASSAAAAPVLTANACQGEDGQWGDLPLKLDVASSAQNGRQLDVGTIQPTVDLPSWLPAKIQPYVGPLGTLTGAGSKKIKVDAWMAVAGNGSTDAPQVLKTQGFVNLVLGGNIFQGFSISSITLSLDAAAATSWHAPDAGGTVDVAQAPAGSLPAIPAGKDGATITPKGSLFIRGSYSGVFSIGIDCQPGGTGGDGSTLSKTFTAGTATTLVSSVFAAGASVIPPVVVATPTPAPVVVPVATPTPKPVATPAPGAGSTPLASTVLAVASPTLKFGSAAVLVTVSCPAGGKDCTGTAAITSAKKLKVGKGAAKVRKIAAGAFTVKAGTTVPVKLKLSADGKKLRKTALVATVTLTPSTGTAVVKRIRANG